MVIGVIPQRWLYLTIQIVLKNQVFVHHDKKNLTRPQERLNNGTIWAETPPMEVFHLRHVTWSRVSLVVIHFAGQTSVHCVTVVSIGLCMCVCCKYTYCDCAFPGTAGQSQTRDVIWNTSIEGWNRHLNAMATFIYMVFIHNFKFIMLISHYT